MQHAFDNLICVLDLIEDQLLLHRLLVQRGERVGGRLQRVQDGGDQPDRLVLPPAFHHHVLDDPHRDAVGVDIGRWSFAFDGGLHPRRQQL